MEKLFQKAENKDLSVSKILNMKTGVNLDTQRVLNDIDVNSLDTFAHNLLYGRIHQNITLVDTQSCYENSQDPRWNNFNYEFLIQDGQHRIDMMKRVVFNKELQKSITLENFSNIKIPVRVITQMDFDDLGDTFVANNSGTALTRQDKLTFLNTNLGNWIVTQSNKHSKIMGQLLGNLNSGRRWDNKIRIALQIFLNQNPYSYDYGYEAGKEFYKRNQPNENFQVFLEHWFKCVEFSNQLEKKNSKQYVILIPYVLRGILPNFIITSNDSLKFIFDDFVNYHKSQIRTKAIISFEDLSISYSEGIQDRGRKFSQLKNKEFNTFVGNRLNEWKSKGYIVKK
jgi:hypothetical protein